MMKKLRDILYVAGGIVMILGACLYVTRWSAAPYVYLVGAVLFAAMQITDTYKGSSFIVKRLWQVSSCSCFIETNGWYVCLWLPSLNCIPLSVSRRNWSATISKKSLKKKLFS